RRRLLGIALRVLLGPAGRRLENEVRDRPPGREEDGARGDQCDDVGPAHRGSLPRTVNVRAPGVPSRHHARGASATRTSATTSSSAPTGTSKIPSDGSPSLLSTPPRKNPTGISTAPHRMSA